MAILGIRLGRLGLATLAGVSGFLTGCATYTTPGTAADFRALGITAEQQDALTDDAIREAMSRKPAASFPAVIATARVQGSGYRSYSDVGYGRGSYTLASLREVETETDLNAMNAMIGIRSVAPLNRMVTTEHIKELGDLRLAAAQVQADMLLLYTFDTRFGVETLVPALGTITLGLFPSRESRVTSTCSAALVDVRTGYIYGLVESTSKQEQLANAWTSETAIEQSRRRAERQAFEGTVKQFTDLWKGVVHVQGFRRIEAAPDEG